MNSITVVAYGAPGSFVRNVQERPDLAIPLKYLATQVAALNPDAGTIGPGMLATLVSDARRALATLEAMGCNAAQPQTAFDRLEDQLVSKLTTLVEPGEGLSIPELLSRFGEAFTPCNGSAMRRALQRTGFKPMRQNYGQRKRVWVAPERTNQGGAS